MFFSLCISIYNLKISRSKYQYIDIYSNFERDIFNFSSVFNDVSKHILGELFYQCYLGNLS